MTRTLLIVKESETEEQLVCSMVNSNIHSFHVRLCFGPSEAKHFLSNYQGKHNTLPELILIDLDLPNRGGIQFLKDLQDLIHECNFMPRVIVIGSMLDEQATHAAMAYPCVRSVVRKPVN